MDTTAHGFCISERKEKRSVTESCKIIGKTKGDNKGDKSHLHILNHLTTHFIQRSKIHLK